MKERSATTSALCEQRRRDETTKEAQRAFTPVNERQRGEKERRLAAPPRERPQKSQEGDARQNHTAYTQHPRTQTDPANSPEH